MEFGSLVLMGNSIALEFVTCASQYWAFMLLGVGFKGSRVLAHVCGLL